MRRFPGALFAVVLSGTGLLAAGCAPAVVTLTSATSNGGWGNAQRIPGIAALAKRGFAYVSAFSCASQANCTAGGYYTTRTGDRNVSHAISVSKAGGTWHKPERLPGLMIPAASASPLAEMSCAGTGNCVAAGSTRAGVAMVSEQVHGVWQPAHQVPGLAALNPGGYSAIGVLSCSAAGWCVAAGTSWKPPKSFPNGRKSVPFVVIEHNGAWHKAQRIPGVLALNHGWLAIISAISCDSVGTCTAGGTYRDRAVDALRPFVVSEHRGAWKPARAIAGVTALPQAASSGNSGIGVMSCSSPGNCTAAGGYGTAKYESLPFVVAEKNGSWGRGQSLPGAIPSSQRYDQSAITGLSCPAPGQCSAAGYIGSDFNEETVSLPFVANEVNGTWSAVRKVPGLAALNKGNRGLINSIWCGTPGNCAVGGFYTGPGGSSFHSEVPDQAFLANESGGTWGNAEQVPGLRALGSRDSSVSFIFCGRSGKCVALGGYVARSGFVKGHIFTLTRDLTAEQDLNCSSY